MEEPGKRTTEGASAPPVKPPSKKKARPEATISETLKEAVKIAEENPDLLAEEADIDWSAYWPHAKPLWEQGWTWRRIYLHFSTQLAMQGRQMPGTAEKFSNAMSQRKARYLEELGQPDNEDHGH